MDDTKQQDAAPTKAEIKATPDLNKTIETAANPEAAPTDDTPYALPVGTPAYVRIGRGERRAGKIAESAAKSEGLSKAQWNKLSADDLAKAFDTEVAAAKKKSTDTGSGDNEITYADTRVHADRGIGGRYVSLGGGERIRVADASTNDGKIAGDEELEKAEA